MKQLKAQRAKTQRILLFTFAAIIALMCLFSSPTIKAGTKSTVTTAAVFAGVFGVTKMQAKEGEGEGEGAEAIVLAKIKKSAAEEAKAIIDANPEIKKIAGLQSKMDEIGSEIKKAASIESVNKLVSEIKEIGIEMKKIADANNGGSGKPTNTIKEALQANKAKLDAFIKSKSGTVQLEDITKASETSTDIDGRSNYFTWHQGGQVGLLPVRKPFIRELLTNVSTGTEYINYIDQETIVRDAKNVALCGATSSNTKVTFKVRNLQILKTRDFVDVCLDMLNDYTFVESQIRLLIEQSLALKIDNNLTFGDSGIGINGIESFASTFNPFNSSPQANYAAAIQYANLIDLMAVAGLQIEAFGQNNMYTPNLILMNPRDYAKIMFYKDTLHNYIKTPMVNTTLYTGATLNIDMGGNARINGMLVRTNPNIAANTAFVMDSTKAFVYSKPGVGIEFAYENRANFEQELVTIKAYERMNMLVRNVDKNAFLFLSDLTSDLAGITAP